MHFTYIIQSLKDHSFYIGYTSNLQQRLDKHNKANKGYTASKKPWRIVYFESFESKTEALKREKFIKAQKSRAFIEMLIREFNNNPHQNDTRLE